MGRYTGPICRQSRREGIALTISSERVLARRDFPPGKKSWRRPRPTEYGLRLREKQKLKRYYGLYEKQFRRFYRVAEHSRGNTGENLLILMERRLDNVVHRMGMAASRREARQMITHGHITVNHRKVDIPSYLVDKEDVIGVKERSRDFLKGRVEWVESQHSMELPSWLTFSPEGLEGKVLARPTREEVSLPVNEQLIVEFCSR